MPILMHLNLPESFYINYENSPHIRCSLALISTTIMHSYVLPSPNFFPYLAVYSLLRSTQEETIPHPLPSHGLQIGHLEYKIDITF